MHVTFIDALQRYFEDGTALVSRDTLVVGRNDLPRRVPLLVEAQTGEWTLIFDHAGPLTADDVIDAHVAAIDLSARAILAGAAGATPEARRWAARFGVRLLDAEEVGHAPLPPLSPTIVARAAEEEAALHETPIETTPTAVLALPPRVEPAPDIVAGPVEPPVAEPPGATAALTATPENVQETRIENGADVGHGLHGVAPPREVQAPPALPETVTLDAALAYFDAVRRSPPPEPLAAVPARVLPWDPDAPRGSLELGPALPWRVPFVGERQAREMSAKGLALAEASLWVSKARLSGLRASLVAEGAASFGESVVAR